MNITIYILPKLSRARPITISLRPTQRAFPLCVLCTSIHDNLRSMRKLSEDPPQKRTGRRVKNLFIRTLRSPFLLGKLSLRCFTPPVSSPSRGEAFPLDGERWDRGETRSYMCPFFMFCGASVMKHSAVKSLSLLCLRQRRAGFSAVKFFSAVFWLRL